MFRKKRDLPSPKPDPPNKVFYSLITLILITLFGFSFAISTLNAINANFRYEETKPDATIREIPIVPYPPNN